MASRDIVLDGNDVGDDETNAGTANGVIEANASMETPKRATDTNIIEAIVEKTGLCRRKVMFKEVDLKDLKDE